nr:PREDICTED: uncharacterized protein LOC103314534 [Tribolium castaneum]|eukprot:XP_015839559.1 PREDICTED: uncharacterized protein LOC103314534 [Tribolium castaneum]
MHISLVAIFVCCSLATIGALPYPSPQEVQEIAFRMQNEANNIISGSPFRQVGVFGVIPVIIRLALQILILPLIYSLFTVLSLPVTLIQFFVSIPFKVIGFVLGFPWSLGSLIFSIVTFPIFLIRTVVTIIIQIISPVISIVSFLTKVVSFLAGLPITISDTVYLYG